MKLHYDPETDSLYIELSGAASVDSLEASPGVVLDFAAGQKLVGIDIEHASEVVDLTQLQAQGLPVSVLSVSGGPREN